MTLSTRSKEAIKTALAMTIAYAISLWMGWNKPYWAGFAVAVISLATTGQSLNKGAMRMLGTLATTAVALIFIDPFPFELCHCSALHQFFPKVPRCAKTHLLPCIS